MTISAFPGAGAERSYSIATAGRATHLRIVAVSLFLGDRRSPDHGNHGRGGGPHVRRGFASPQPLALRSKPDAAAGLSPFSHRWWENSAAPSLKAIRHIPLLWPLAFVTVVLVAQVLKPKAHTLLIVLSIMAIVSGPR
jgi:hypothetical protein